MSRRPSFRNPFSRIALKAEAVVGETRGMSPLDPLMSADEPHPTSSAMDNFLDLQSTVSTNAQTPAMPGPSQILVASAPSFSNAAVQTEWQEAEAEAASDESVTRSRKGSLARIRDAGRSLVPSRLKRLANKWTQKHTDSEERDTQTPPPDTSKPPVRPPRPPSLDIQFLQEMDDILFNDVASHSTASHSSRVPLTGSLPCITRNAIAFPKARPVASARAEVVNRLVVAAPFPSPSPEQDRTGTFKIGVAPGRQTSLPERLDFWSVVQQNNLRVPSVSVSRWMTGGVLGAGGFGRVYLVYNTATRSPCALKVVQYSRPMSESSCRGLINELRVLSTLGSEPAPMPFLLQPFLHDHLWAWTSSKGYLHITTDACMGGELTAYKGKLPPYNLTLVCAEIVGVLASLLASYTQLMNDSIYQVLGLNHLHRHGIVHHDLKPHNVLINSGGHCVVADFGGAQFLNREGKLVRESDTTRIMTTAYAAPELLVDVEEGKVEEYDERVDYWSLGTTLVSMLMDDEFLPGTSDISFMRFRVQQIRSALQDLRVAVEMQGLIMNLLQMDPALRLTYQGIVGHPLFRRLDWGDVRAQKRAAIPHVHTVAATAFGWRYDTPKVHKTRDAPADFLEVLRNDRMLLAVNDSYDVEEQLAKIIPAL